MRTTTRRHSHIRKYGDDKLLIEAQAAFGFGAADDLKVALITEFERRDLCIPCCIKTSTVISNANCSSLTHGG